MLESLEDSTSNVIQGYRKKSVEVAPSELRISRRQAVYRRRIPLGRMLRWDINERGGDSLVFRGRRTPVEVTKGRFDLWPAASSKYKNRWLLRSIVSREIWRCCSNVILTLLISRFKSFMCEKNMYKRNRRCPLMKQVMYQFKRGNFNRIP